jgi:hypothetical protein
MTMQIPNFHEDDGTGDTPERKFARWVKEAFTPEEATAIFAAIAQHWLDTGQFLNYAGMQNIVDRATSAE